MKYRVLQRLREGSPDYVSGEALSNELNVSRTAVWKYINELKSEGYIIASSSRKGYRLDDSADVVNADEIRYNLSTKMLGREIHYFSSIDSTNTYAKKIANDGCSDGTAVIADIQSSGRGRLGRAWSSPGGKGIWMSVVLRPLISPADVQVITLAASIAVVKAVRRTTGIVAGIKWPNDIILGGRKVCGILTEMSCEMDRINFIVIGIGLNVNQELYDFPEELREMAVSLKMHSSEGPAGEGKDNMKINHKRSGIIRAIFEELEQVYKEINKKESSRILEEWKSFSVTIGREICISSADESFTGTAVGITHEGKLIIRSNGGITREISSGEVSVRGMLGYI